MDPRSTAALMRIGQDIAQGHEIIASDASPHGIAQAATSVNADIVFPTMLPLGSSRVAHVGYLFDFQHRHIPEMFPARIRRNRDLRFAKIAADADAVIVNSKAVAKDAEVFLNLSSESILTIPYTPHAHPWWFDVKPAEVQRRYGIGAHYLLISNHFWKHKDHATALQAFALLRQDYPDMDLHLALTGDPVDHRDPRHYSKLVAISRALGITDSTHFLGLIPKRDQLALLRGCATLLQPTRFEGGPGGGSVYEAIGLGVPAVVSDIPVNLEIDQGDIRFFKTGDAADLARHVAAILSSPPARPSRETLLARGDANLAKLGNAICDYLSHIVEH